MQRHYQQRRDYSEREPWAPRPGETPLPGFQNQQHFLGDRRGYPAGPSAGGTYDPSRGGYDERGGGETYNDFPSSAGRGSADAGQQQTRRRGVAPRGYQRSDERIREDVCERLMDDGMNCGGLEVAVRSGIVELSGEVDQRSDKHRIEQVAANVSGVSDVNNQLRVRGRSGDASRPHPAAGSPTTGIAGAVIKGTTEQEGTSRYRE